MNLPGQSPWEQCRDHPIWRHPVPSVLVTLLALALAVGLVYRATENWGPGANSDGLTYLVLARELYRHGRYGTPLPGGGWKPMSHFPPGYPLAIATFAFFTHGDEARAAQWLNLVCLALVVLLSAREVYRVTRHLFPTAATVLWLAASFHLLRIFAWVLSEALFLAQILLLAWAMEAWRERASLRHALLTGLITAWSVATRWIALILPVWVLAWMAWSWRRKRPSDWRYQMGAFFLAWGLPTLALMAVSRMSGGVVASRTLGWHPPEGERWFQAARTVASWLVDPFQELTPAQAWGRAIGVLAGLGVLVVLARAQAPHFPQGKERTRHLEAFLVRWGGFALLYLLGLVAAITFLDASTPMDWRLLAPEHLALSLVGGVTAWYALARWWPLVLILLWAWVHLMRTVRVHDEFFLLGRWHRHGAVLRSADWQTLDVWPLLRSLPDHVTLYTNEREETLYYADHPAYALRLPVWKDGRAYECDPVRGDCKPLPYTHEAEWAQDMARRTRGTCTLMMVLHHEAVQTVEQRTQARKLLQVLTEAGFRIWKRWPGATLLLPPDTPTDCLQEAPSPGEGCMGACTCCRNQANLDGWYSLGSLYKRDNVASGFAACNIISSLFLQPRVCLGPCKTPVGRRPSAFEIFMAHSSRLLVKWFECAS